MWDKIRKEGAFAAGLFGILVVIFQIVFHRESFFVVLRVSSAVMWMYVIPGYCLMLFWNEELKLSERLAVGSMLSAGIVGISSYYLGLIGININYLHLIIPPILMAIGISALFIKKS